MSSLWQLGGGGGGMDSLGGLGDIFGAPSSNSYVPPAEVRNLLMCQMCVSLFLALFVKPVYLGVHACVYAFYASQLSSFFLHLVRTLLLALK